jgi:hypothetical protein
MLSEATIWMAYLLSTVRSMTSLTIQKIEHVNQWCDSVEKKRPHKTRARKNRVDVMIAH